MKQREAGHARFMLRAAKRPRFFQGCARGGVILAMLLTVVFTTVFLFAYTHEQDNVNGGPVTDMWCSNGGVPCSLGISWSLGPTGSNVDTSGGSIVQALQNAFVSWQSANLNGQPLLAFSSVVQGPASNQTAPNACDGVNVISFTDASSDFSTGTIAFTSIATAPGPGQSVETCQGSVPSQATYSCPISACIVDADIMFNPAYKFSTASPTPTGDYDLQAIATHEIGHMLGMDHSGLASSIMFAFGDNGGVPQRALSIDDAVGLGSIYPSQNYATITGTLSGTITLSGAGAFASHVVVIDASTGAAVVDTLTNTNGTYSVFAPPGEYNVIALPLAGVYDVSDFSGWACGYNENAPPCCDPATNTSCNSANALNPPVNYSGKFH